MKERRLTSRCGAPGKLSELILSIWTEHHDTHRAERPFRISQQRRFASGPVTIDYAGRGRQICFPPLSVPEGVLAGLRNCRKSGKQIERCVIADNSGL
jgi:hypothetical protein